MERKYPEFDNSHTLLKAASAQALYKALVVQLIKDFKRANVAHGFNQEMDPEELYIALKEKLYVLLLEDFTDYLNLMYMVDVPERAMKELELTDAVEVADQLAFLVLRREWQKVWLKANYKS